MAGTILFALSCNLHIGTLNILISDSPLIYQELRLGTSLLPQNVVGSLTVAVRQSLVRSVSSLRNILSSTSSSHGGIHEYTFYQLEPSHLGLFFIWINKCCIFKLSLLIVLFSNFVSFCAREDFFTYIQLRMYFPAHQLPSSCDLHCTRQCLYL